MDGGHMLLLEPAGRVRHHRRRGARQPAHRHADAGAEAAHDGRSGRRARRRPRRRPTTRICCRCSISSSACRSRPASWRSRRTSRIRRRARSCRAIPKFLARHHSVAFLADSIKVIIVGGMAPHDLEALMDEDLQVHHDEERGPSAALTKIGRRAARPRHRRGGARHRDHDAGNRRAAVRDRP